MENNDNTLIEAYFDGRLAAEEQKAFELRLKKDQALAAAFEQRKQMQAYLKGLPKQEKLEKQLESIGQQYFGGTEGKVVSISTKQQRNRSLALITSLVAAATVTFLILFFNPFAQSDLYQQYALHEPLDLTEKSLGGDELATKAEKAFNEQDYDAAVVALEAYLVKNPQALKAKLFRGIALLEADRIAESQAIFTTISLGNSALALEAKWYLALSYLKAEDFATTRSLLQTIPDSDGYWFQKAQQLLKELP